MGNMQKKSTYYFLILFKVMAALAANIRSPPIFLSVTPQVFFTTHGVEGKYFSIYGKRRLYIVIFLN